MMMGDVGPCHRWNRPWLWLPSQWAHDWAPYFLNFMTKWQGEIPAETRAFQWRGLSFRNPLGIAGGVDKSGLSLLGWQNFGAGFLEVGTVTPRPQSANPGIIMKRSLTHWALWNKMGFPNPGSNVVYKNVKKFAPYQKVPLFVNLGKNRETSNDRAVDDYLAGLEKMASLADGFVINISSPNTKGLRNLQQNSALEQLLVPILERQQQLCPKKPILLKLSPDMEMESLLSIVEFSLKWVDGWILTNTTTDRPASISFPREGGLSGRPLAEQSKKCLSYVLQGLGDKRKSKLVVSVGGIMSSEDVHERLALGADLVQVYSGLVFHGPNFFKNTLQGLRNRN